MEIFEGFYMRPQLLMYWVFGFEKKVNLSSVYEKETVLYLVEKCFFTLKIEVFLLIISMFSIRGLMEISMFSHEKRSLSEKAWIFSITTTKLRLIPSFRSS
jgi:hypothetical protein